MAGRVDEKMYDAKHAYYASLARGLDGGVMLQGYTSALGVTRQQLYKVVNGNSVVTPEMAVRLEKGVRRIGRCVAPDASEFRPRESTSAVAAIEVKRLEPKVA